MNEYFKRDVSKRMMYYVHSFRVLQNTPVAKYKKGVFADINKNFTICNNTGMLQTDVTNSCVSEGYTRYKFKGFDWTEETLMLALEKLYKINFIKNRVKDLEKDFE